MAESAYSFSLTTFSPSGKLVQIEYALNAVASGSTSLGVKAKNGVVIATEKKLPTCLIDETTVQKIVHLTENIAVVYSGMGPDFRVLVRKGRKSAQQYYRVYRETIPVAMLVRELAAVGGAVSDADRKVMQQMTDADKKRMLQMKITEHMRNREEAAKILRG